MRTNKNENKLSKYSIEKTGKGIHVHVDFAVVGTKMDLAQEALDAQVWADMQKYMPRATGNLIQQTAALNAVTSGKVYAYDPNVEYAHYLWEGELYVDPVYRVGGFYSPDYGFWSRPGVKKVPSGMPLFYTNPNATAHWNETAINNHMQDWVEVVRRALEE